MACDMPSARTAEGLWCVERFQRHLDGIVSMRTVYSGVCQVYLPLIITDFDRVYFYQNLDGWVKDL